MEARLRNGRISPRKLGLAAKMVRNQKVVKADVSLKFAEKKSCDVLRKLINSAAANAVQKGEVLDNLIIKSIFIGDGVTIKRFQPRARGSGYQILKRTVNALVVLDVIDPNIKGEVGAKNKSSKISEEGALKHFEERLKDKVSEVVADDSIRVSDSKDLTGQAGMVDSIKEGLKNSEKKDNVILDSEEGGK